MSHLILGLTVVLCWIVAAGNAGYLLLALLSIWMHRAPAHLAAASDPPPTVTVLKPLCGAEPGLELALESFLAQAVDGPLRIVFGVASAQDGALRIAQEAAHRHPEVSVEFCINHAQHGANPKVSNLINMASRGLDEIVVVSDSDVVIPQGALQRLIDQFRAPDVGATTTLYRGRPVDGGHLAQRMGALYLDGWYLPSAILHARLASPQVCFGPMTALRRAVLDRTGGFQTLADSLADDTELGSLTRRAGYRIAFSPDIAETWVSDGGIAALFAHELRWARTIRALKPVGYVASIFTHPGPAPLLLALLSGGVMPWAVCAGLIILRWSLVQATWRKFGRARDLPNAGPILLWLREQLYFAVWICGHFGRHIVWRGNAFTIGAKASLIRPDEPRATLEAA